MIDLTPLQVAYKNEQDPFQKKLLKLALDLLSSGLFAHFKRVFESGEHRSFLSPNNADALGKVMIELSEVKKEKIEDEGEVEIKGESLAKDVGADEFHGTTLSDGDVARINSELFDLLLDLLPSAFEQEFYI